MQCGGVALYAEYQKTHILWHFLSVEGSGSDSAPSEASRVPVTSFATEGKFLAHEIPFSGINKILYELVNNLKKSGMC